MGTGMKCLRADCHHTFDVLDAVHDASAKTSSPDMNNVANIFPGYETNNSSGMTVA